MAGKQTVLYVTGMTRCGSTMIGNVLNEVPGFVHIGELHYLWRNGILGSGTNSTCGCGTPLACCPLWSDVLGDAFTDVATARRMVAVQDRWLRTRHTAARLAEARGPLHPPADVEWATGLTRDIYRAVGERAGTRVVVDSSKYPAEAAALSGRDDLDVRVLHVVRDPRATAFSYRRDKSYVRQMSAARSTATWGCVNLASDLLAVRAEGAYLRVRHEDFGRAPKQVLAEIMRFAGIEPGAAGPVGADGAVELGDNHTVTGNPDRLNRGRVAIRCDERWRDGLAVRPRVVATAGALPQLLRYGYPVTTIPERTL
ncbi:sulfotransferase domain-containing protein [Actinophytocola oryzae]|uniref:Sulfotransferase domain-containing protein n=1 Tax=Actinophytocola oryzae TaxID=502181 RepID=A0A4V3FU86_9PSEU|nr:sulfotransferase domain-containing protein [Actinophytocola oryzae]TDV54231.1 sulfotransferase domain-containing protein [Actinophytocola oryzae]